MLLLVVGASPSLPFAAPGHSSLPPESSPASSVPEACAVVDGPSGSLAHGLRRRIEHPGSPTCCLFLTFYLLEV